MSGSTPLYYIDKARDLSVPSQCPSQVRLSCSYTYLLGKLNPRKSSVEPLLANQLFCMLPSSNVMGAVEKLERGSRWGKKGACQWNHSGRPSGWLATIPAEHGCLSNALQFPIANLELEFKLSPKRISNLKISNRKFMTIFQSENWAASEFRRLQPTISTGVARGSSHA